MDLSPFAVALSAAVLFVNAAISLKLDLGMHWQLLVASIRYGHDGAHGCANVLTRTHGRDEEVQCSIVKKRTYPYFGTSRFYHKALDC